MINYAVTWLATYRDFEVVICFDEAEVFVANLRGLVLTYVDTDFSGRAIDLSDCG